MKNWIKDVAVFHKHIGFEAKIISSARLKHHVEEINEFKKALEEGDLIEVADGIGDNIYLWIGTALILGIDLRPVWDAIQVSNMTKTGDPSNPKNCFKGKDYKKPKIAKALHDGDLSDVQ